MNVGAGCVRRGIFQVFRQKQKVQKSGKRPRDDRLVPGGVGLWLVVGIKLDLWQVSHGSCNFFRGIIVVV